MMHYCANKLSGLSLNPSVMDLSKDLFQAMIETCSLNIDTEDNLLELITSWYQNHTLSNATEPSFLSNLLKLINWPLVSQNQLINIF